MALTKEQLLLLNNLMYIDNDPPFRKETGYKTVSEWINSIDTTQINDDQAYGSYTTGQDWKKTIQAIKNDPEIMQMKIVTSHVDHAEGGGGGYSIIFANDDTKEAAVVFRGTAGDEWKDNFTGGNVTDTDQQKNALKWYQDAYKEYGLDQYEVTVTGHSKGGNKSKYITIMDDSIDHCVSFDGQGFSDKFMEKYRDQIAERQDKIENHNVDYDYVNLLLNDIGKTTYYEGKDIGNGGGGFFENHCPNSFMDWKEDGSFTMAECPDGQPSEMKAVDEFFNNCLRSLPDDERDKMLSMIYKFVMFGFSLSDSTAEKAWNDFRDIMHDPEYSEVLPYLIAYLIQYERNNPEMAEQIRSFLNHFGYEEYVKYIDAVDDVLNFEYDKELWFNIKIHLDFDDLVNIINGAAGVISADWILNWIAKKIKEKTGVDVDKEDLRLLVEIIDKVDRDMDEIHIEDNGSDIKIKGEKNNTKAYRAGHGCRFRVRKVPFRKSVDEMKGISYELDKYCSGVFQKRNLITFTTKNASTIRNNILKTSQDLKNISDKMTRMSEMLDNIWSLYEKTESKLGM